MQTTTDVSKISKTVRRDLAFILNGHSELSIHFPSSQMFFLKRMLLVSHKVIFIENEAALLYTAMRERARAFAATT